MNCEPDELPGGTSTLTTCPLGIVTVKTWPATTPGGTVMVIDVACELENDMPVTSGFNWAGSVGEAGGGDAGADCGIAAVLGGNWGCGDVIGAAATGGA